MTFLVPAALTTINIKSVQPNTAPVHRLQSHTAHLRVSHVTWTRSSACVPAATWHHACHSRGMAQQRHICAASSSHQRLRDTVTALHGPLQSSAAAYAVGITPGSEPDVEHLTALLQDLARQGQKQVMILLDPTAAAGPTALTNSADTHKQHQQSSPLIQCCEAVAAAHQMQLQVVLIDRVQQQQQQEETPASKENTAHGWSVLHSVLKSSVGLAKRVSKATVSAVRAASQAATTAQFQAGVDLVPDLPDVKLRMRRRRWEDPERAALSWQAAVLFCRVIKQLQDQGFEVEISMDGGSSTEEEFVILSGDGDKEKAAFAAFEAVQELLAQASEEGSEALSAESVQQWLAVLWVAEDPQVVVSELSLMLEEGARHRQQLEQQGLRSGAPKLPSALDVMRRLDAKDSAQQDDGQREGASGSVAGQTDGAKDDEPAAAAAVHHNTGEGKQGLSEQDAMQVTDAAGESADGSSGSTADSSSSSDKDSNADSSSMQLTASDAVVSASSSRTILEAVMRLESTWSKNLDNSSKRSSSGNDTKLSGNTSSDAPGSEKPVPVLLPRPIMPPRPGTGTPSSDSSQASDSNTSSSAGEAAGTDKPASTVRRVRRQNPDVPTGAAEAGFTADGDQQGSGDSASITPEAAHQAADDTEVTSASGVAAEADKLQETEAGVGDVHGEHGRGRQESEEELGEPEQAAFEQYVRSEFARFEAYLSTTGVELSREARIEAFVELYGNDSDSDEADGDMMLDGADMSAVLQAILTEPSDGSTSGTRRKGSAKQRARRKRSVDSKSDDAGFEQADSSVRGDADNADAVGPATPRSGSGSTGLVGAGWEQLRNTIGVDGLERLQELLRADSLRMTGWDLSDMQLLSDALNRIMQGDRLATDELRIISKLLKEAEAQLGSSSSTAGASDPPRGRVRRHRPTSSTGGSNRKTSSSGRVPGFNVSAKDLPFDQDTRAIRLPKPYSKRRRERIQQLLRQLRQSQQQQRQLRQQRAAQVQLLRLQHELRKQGSAAALEGQPFTQSSQQQPIPQTRVDSSIRAEMPVSAQTSPLTAALQGFKAAWQDDKQAAVSRAPGAAGTNAGDGRRISQTSDAEAAASALVAQLGAMLSVRGEAGYSTAQPGQDCALVAVVPAQHLAAVEAAWEQQGSGA